MFRMFLIFSLLLLNGCGNKYSEEEIEKRGIAIGQEEGFKKGYREGQLIGYNYAQIESGNLKGVKLTSLDEVFFNKEGESLWALFFAVIDLFLIGVAVIYLLVREAKWRIVIGKGLVLVISSYVWFRYLEPISVGDFLFTLDYGLFGTVVITLFSFGISYLTFRFFDYYYLRSDARGVWRDSAGIVFCTLLFLVFVHYMINAGVTLVGMIPMKLDIIGSATMGGVLYTVQHLFENKNQPSLRTRVE